MQRQARRVAIAAMFLGCILPSRVRAQQSTVPLPVPGAASGAAPAATTDTKVTLDFKNAELATVIETIARLTHRNFLFDDRVRGTVTVISPEPVTLAEAYRVFESILQVKGFTTVKGPGGILKIIPLREAKSSAIQTVPPTGRVANRDLYITRLIPLHYVKADAITNVLRPLVSKDANMVAYAPTNTVILTDSSTNVRRLLTIIGQIDIASYQERIKVIPIQFADASMLASHLDEIFSGGAAPARRPARVRGRVPATAQAAVTVFGQAGRPRFITDERTNSIIVIASLATSRRVGELIELLDFQRKGSGKIHVVRLQNADAEEMAQTLASLTGGGSAPGGAAGGAAGAAALQAGLVAQLQGDIRLTADAPTNSLIVQATAEGFRALKEVIEALDTKRPQVMVEALIMEVNVTNDETLGAGILFQGLINGKDNGSFTIGSDTGSTGISGATTNSGLVSGAAPGTFTSAVLGRTVNVLNPVTNVMEAIPVIQAAITAAAKNDNTNIISAPTILTADNEEAQIVIGQNIPIITSQVQSAAGTTNALGSLATSQNVERQDVGVTLRVTPQISEGNTVRLNIFQEISGVIGDISANSTIGPTLTTRTVEDTVYVEDGEAVIIGGILKEDENDTVTKVPFLGDIPILGWLFKSTSKKTTKTNLIIIITPHIIRAPGDLEQITVENREKFRSASDESLGRTDEQKEARRKALAAGIALPLDPNPVRRELEAHTAHYPTEALPDLRQNKKTRDEKRRLEMEKLEREEQTRSYRVHVTTLQDPEAARELLGKLIDRGYDGTILSTPADSGVLHSIELGPYASPERAQQVARELHAQQGFDARVVVEPPR